MSGSEPTSGATVDLAALAGRVHTFDSFGRAVAGMMLRAAAKAEVGTEVSVPVEAKLQLVSLPGRGLRIYGCICVQEEGCPCVDFGDLLDEMSDPFRR